MSVETLSSTLRVRLSAFEKRQPKPITVPKYQRLCEVVMEGLKAGELKPGDKFPPETLLASVLPLSLGTIQKAINILADQQILERTQGRGTFVKEHNKLDDLWHFRFLADEESQILPVYTNTISVRKTKVINKLSNHQFPNCDSYVRITRHINLNNKFGAIGQYYLDANLCSDLLEEPLSYFDGVHLRDIIYQRFGLSTATVKVYAVSRPLPNAVCKWLGLNQKTTGLVNQIIGLDPSGQAISWQNVFIPPNAPPLEICVSQPKP
jgi:DNA-binding GntR family transcriptional regulator